MAARIRMKMMGRKHRPFFRICAVDSRSPRDGKVLEELGTYDPLLPEVDGRVLLNAERVSYWLGVGALPSHKVSVLFKKYGPQGTHLDAHASARERLALPKQVPEAPEAVFVLQPKSAKGEEAPAAEAPATDGAAESAATDSATEGASE